MYKTFAKDSGEAYRREQDSPSAAAATTSITTTAAMIAASSSPKFVGMHAARCFLGALDGYSGTGWLAAEEYACTVLPTEVCTVGGFGLSVKSGRRKMSMQSLPAVSCFTQFGRAVRCIWRPTSSQKTRVVIRGVFL